MNLPAINLSGEELSRLDEALRTEWLLTNGLGGYASSTALGINTRKYHGLLVAALHPPRDRTVCLAKLDDDAIINNQVIQLNANEFPDRIYPQGYRFLNAFSLSPFPTYVYEAEGVEVTKTIFIPHGKNAVVVIYKVRGGKVPAKLRVYPLVTCRHFHSIVDRRSPLELKQQSHGKKVVMGFKAPKATVITASTDGEFVEKPTWIDQVSYREDAARGESSKDDLYQPGFFEIGISSNNLQEFAVTAAASENNEEANSTIQSFGTEIHEINTWLKREKKQREELLSKFYNSHQQLSQSDWLAWILHAADSFIVKGAGEECSIIAGYHWFEAWGRDTFISLPGLTLVTGRFDDAERILFSFARYLKQGLIPNFIPDKSGEPSYNTVDATLWYINAVLQYLKYTGNFQLVHENLWENLKTIIASHEKGTLFGIRLDSDGLLSHGPRLTWMDAEVNGEVITPRAGKAVEIQALWYNALKTMQFLARKFDDENLSLQYGKLAGRAHATFSEKFWDKEMNCLYDVLNEAGVDSSLRPNQIIAAALDFPIIDRDKAEKIVDTVQQRLLTPCGFRTLAQNDPKYRGRYVGDHLNRDRAYHNGTVWPWLTGPFTTAFIKIKGTSDQNREYAAKTFIMPLLKEQLFKAGLGTVSEIFDGDPPHTPRGCISQAWSVAEPLRAYVEDVMQVKPVHEKEVLQLSA